MVGYSSLKLDSRRRGWPSVIWREDTRIAKEKGGYKWREVKQHSEDRNDFNLIRKGRKDQD